MKKISKFIDEHAYGLAITLFVVALAIDFVVFIASSIAEGFKAYNLVMLIFEIVLNGFLVYGLASKNNKVSFLFMVAIKVFDAIFFSAAIGLRIDAYYADYYRRPYLSYLNFVSYALSTALLIVILVFFFLNWFTGKHKYWIIVKCSIALAAVIMLICAILEIVNLVCYSAEWFDFLEPLYMSVLLSGMFIVCHFIEKEK